MIKTKRALRYIMVVLPFLPLLVFFLPESLPIDDIDDPFDIDAPFSAWRMGIRLAVVLLLIAYFALPNRMATLFGLFGTEPSAVAWWICALAYTGAISYGVYRWTKPAD